MIIWGGTTHHRDHVNGLNTGGIFDPATNTWSPMSIVGVPEGVYFPSAVWTGNEMVVWGGQTVGGTYVSSGARYDLAADSWTAIQSDDAPSPRAFSEAVWTGIEMIVWGGYIGSTRLDTGGRYNPATDGWTPTTQLNAPPGRNGNTSVWTGEEVIVWGGYGNPISLSTPFLNTGGRYTPTENLPPEVDAGGPYDVYENGSVQVTAIGTDPENQPLLYEWDLDNNGSFETPGQSPTFSAVGLAAPSTHTISVRVTDSGGLTYVDEATVTALIYHYDVFYVSPATNGTISGITYTGSDILQYTKSTNTWAMYFDGSDVGVTKNVSAFAFLPNGDILLSFAANQVIAGQGTFAAHDVARFDPTTTGDTTAGAFTWYFDGSDVGLTTSGEKIDALDALADGRLLISTGGAAGVPKSGGTYKWQDEDVMTFTPTALGATTTGTWATAVYFDGTAVTGLGAEDVNGFAVDEVTNDRYLTILGAFKLGSLSGNGKSIVKLPAGSNTPALVPWTTPLFNVDGLELTR